MNQLNEKSYTEILEIIKYLPHDEYEKIPKEKLEFYKKYKDPLYKFEYNPSKSLNEQNVLRETKVLIVNLFRDVVATKVQKEKLNRILDHNEQEYQVELCEKYSYDKIFNKKNIKAKTEKTEKNTQMVAYKENIFFKLYYIFKRLFNKRI